MRIYIICPVRKAGSEIDLVSAYVADLESQGHVVHYPPRDVDQTDDGVGLRICQHHRDAMEKADEVHVWWNPDSTGSHFDFGMAYALHKPVVVVNSPNRTPNKSYTNILLAVSDGL